MDLRHPEALLYALPFLALTWLAARRSAAGLSPRRFWGGLILRSAAILALVLGVAELRSVLPHDERAVVFVVDASASVGARGRKQAQDWTDQAWQARSERDLGALVLVAGEARVDQTLGRDLERPVFDAQVRAR